MLRTLLEVLIGFNLVLWGFIGGQHVAGQQVTPDYTAPIIGHLIETERGATAICYIYDDRIFLGCENQ